MQSKTVLFDINETVLDLSRLKPLFSGAFGDQSLTGIWFSWLLHSSTVCALTHVKSDFAKLAAAALDKLAAARGMNNDFEGREQILSTFANLEAHQDIKPALSKLREAGYKCVAFSNSSSALISAQISHAGLSEYFDAIISVEEFGSFKPDAQVYQCAANKLNAPIEELRLVATHDWDTHGALSAGMQAAYIDRGGMPYHPLYLRPNIEATNMLELASLIIAADKRYN
ncbi:haloacid dehalogenase type II [Alginatibacterium sediminis]|uniref:(S)-2-haloacid dehalogenase n=1 Tax=Alginatibacterium sediminis TaxID=2164068 RepID=A0A420E8Y5_9ALTE|nr:haloacid dehalogenase type II [Alginatibacterium sediminis]RKF15744.1 haloacid dehalogenase type II [Alginatibacterium sediminis]